MNDLNRWTADELVRLHNARAPASDRVTGPWRRPKRELIEMIRALGDRPNCDQAVAAAGKAETVGSFVEAMLSTDATYAEIARLARLRFDDARTTARSVASAASALRKREQAVRRIKRNSYN